MTTPSATYQTRQTEAVVIVRMLPPSEVSPNYHGSWRKKAAAVAEFREQAALATRLTTDADSFSGKRDPVTNAFEIAWCCGRKRLDDDNAKAALKAAIDGISDVLWGGQDRHVRIGKVKQIRGQGTVTMTLRGES
jgi:hypothetical protein